MIADEAVGRSGEEPELVQELTDVEVVVEARGTPAEGPTWDTELEVLWWVDINGQTVHAFDPRKETDRVIPVDQPVGAVVPRTRGGLVAAVRDGFAMLDPADGKLEMIHTLDPSDPPVRMNDGKCDIAGRFWAGTMGFRAEAEAGALYRLDPDGSAHQMLGSVTISNGLDWSRDNATMYYIDSMTWGVDAFDFDPATGEIENRRRLIDIPREDGVADGMTLDSDGFLWVAVFGGWCVRRYAPDGTLDTVVRLPARQVTSCAFGGADLSDLYITTAATRLSDEELSRQPLAGSVFRCRPGPRGLPAHSFGG